ncbi:L-serine dehydratase [Penicillium alfredii]|uniref:L-serine ammonia-lyase n=1 Tax=Penicillium alfredii TaxID=1506179 RepID=A0A9W9EM61_9EURO|nr:L-serine dehydratase [Penicillium alfredii]KAJ5084413.1 L-serine dehydratase [Penicillium alfredii]
MPYTILATSGIPIPEDSNIPAAGLALKKPTEDDKKTSQALGISFLNISLFLSTQWDPAMARKGRGSRHRSLNRRRCRSKQDGETTHGPYLVEVEHDGTLQQNNTDKRLEHGSRVFLKLELLQPSGSFKSRGIGNLILSTLKDPANAGKNVHFFISSGGNAGLAAVHAARDLGCPCTVVVPHSTKPFMISKLQAAGATAVIQQGASWFEADTFLRKTYIDRPQEGTADDAGNATTNTVNVYVPPFDDPRVWAGAATMVEEIAAQLPPRPSSESSSVFPADAIVCSVGGGGLFNGIVEGTTKCLQSSSSSVSSEHAPENKVHILAAETQGAHSLAHSLHAGELQSLSAITSQANALGALCVARQAFVNATSPPPGVQVTSVVGSDAEAAKGILRLADEARLEVELACGISVEVAIGGKLAEVLPGFGPESRVVVVVCGGSNISAEMIAEYRRQLENGWE